MFSFCQVPEPWKSHCFTRDLFSGFLLIMACFFSSGTWAISDPEDFYHLELWFQVTPSTPSTRQSYRLPDGRGVCLHYNENSQQWLPGFIGSSCLNYKGVCECHFYDGGESHYTRSYWALKSNKSLLFSESGEEHPDNAIQIFRDNNLFNLCFILAQGYYNPGLLTEAGCEVNGFLHPSYFYIYYSSTVASQMKISEIMH